MFARSRRQIVRRLAGPVIIALLVVGCGKPVARGKVSYKGQALNSGSVTFVGADGKEKSSAINPDGTYSIIEPPKGEVKVGVSVSTASGSISAPPPGAPRPVIIPATYADPKTSGITKTVGKGSQTIDIDLQ
jgi:hypothetical protein